MNVFDWHCRDLQQIQGIFYTFFIRNPDVNHKKKNDNVSFCKQTETLQKLKKYFQS